MENSAFWFSANTKTFSERKTEVTLFWKRAPVFGLGLELGS